jgi:hypothetical protein
MLQPPKGGFMITAHAVPNVPVAGRFDPARTHAADRAGSEEKTYLSHIDDFEPSQGVDVTPARPELVALSATAMVEAGRKVSTLGRAATTFDKIHCSRGIDWSRSHTAVSRVLGLLESAADDIAGRRVRALLTLAGLEPFGGRFLSTSSGPRTASS